MAARKAEKLGYTNVKVFHAGMPVWTEAAQVVLTDGAFVEQMMGYLVLLDLRGGGSRQKILYPGGRGHGPQEPGK